MPLPKVVALLWLLLTGETGVATTFWSDGDPGNPDSGMACYHGKPLVDSALLAAHPTLPCKSKVLVYNIRTKKWTIVTVADRGPRRALIDLSIGATKAIKANGLEPVIISPLPPNL